MLKKDDSPLKLSELSEKEEKNPYGPDAGMVTITNVCKKTEKPSLLHSTLKQQPVV